MSQDNVEVARAAVAAWNEGDMEGLCELYDPDAVMYYAGSDWPEPGPYLGRDAIMRQFRWLRDTWDRDALRIVGDVLAPGDRVLVRATWHVAGIGPGGDIEMAWVYTVRKGLIVRADFFRDFTDALEAVGLSE
jgi:ketosteroid isomerase-like protein